MKSVDKPTVLKIVCVIATFPIWGASAVNRDGGTISWHGAGWWHTVLFVSGCLWSIVEAFGVSYVMECAAIVDGKSAKRLYAGVSAVIICLLVSIGGTMYQMVTGVVFAQWGEGLVIVWILATVLLTVGMPALIGVANVLAPAASGAKPEHRTDAEQPKTEWALQQPPAEPAVQLPAATAGEPVAATAGDLIARKAAMRAMFESGSTTAQVAVKFGVSETTARRAKNGG